MRIKTSNGFTLVEIMITIIILGILASVTVPMLMGSFEDSKGLNATANLRLIATSARIYYNETGDTSLNTFTSLGGINTLYNIDIKDSDFTYTGSQTGSSYTFTATRNSGSQLDKYIEIDEDSVISGDWPWMHG